MRNEEHVSIQPIDVKAESGVYKLQSALDSSGIFNPNQAVELSATAVIQSVSGNISHWALRHVGKVPDFHLRPSFVLSIE